MQLVASKMLSAVVLVVLALASSPIVTEGRIYDRCELARDLRFNYNIPMRDLATWVCIAQRESDYNTQAVGPPNTDGSRDHGIFQINDRYWCSPPGRGCGVSCETIRNSMDASVRCAKFVKKATEQEQGSSNGFTAWTTYRYCRNPSSYLDGCFPDSSGGGLGLGGSCRPEPSWFGNNFL